MIENKLNDSEKQKYFNLATIFKISDDISIEHRGELENHTADKGAITRQGKVCYNNRDCKWEWEPSPSNRTDGFIARTRYPLDKAFEIVNSKKFKKYLK
jgi:hypothetical protein